ncbi:MAG: hypothetical protein K0B15_08890 [Lentimicrobium sp.]|nr:hypothetical protein [Lentimicrobium sp.]
MQDSPLINIGLYLAYVLIAVAAISAIAFPIIQTFGNLKKAKTGLIGFAVLVGVLLIAYLVSPAETGAFYEKKNISPGASKLIGGGLLATYIVFAGVVISILYAEVAKWFK